MSAYRNLFAIITSPKKWKILKCPVCKQKMNHKMAEEGIPESYYCLKDNLVFSPEEPHECLGEMT